MKEACRLGVVEKLPSTVHGSPTVSGPHTCYGYPEAPNSGLSPPRLLFWLVTHTCYNFMHGPHVQQQEESIILQ